MECGSSEGSPVFIFDRQLKAHSFCQTVCASRWKFSKQLSGQINCLTSQERRTLSLIVDSFSGEWSVSQTYFFRSEITFILVVTRRWCLLGAWQFLTGPRVVILSVSRGRFHKHANFSVKFEWSLFEYQIINTTTNANQLTMFYMMKDGLLLWLPVSSVHADIFAEILQRIVRAAFEFCIRLSAILKSAKYFQAYLYLAACISASLLLSYLRLGRQICMFGSNCN